MSKVECPYCEKEHEVDMCDGGDWSQDARREEECPHCEKSFIATVEWNPTFWAEKADCLNGGEHNLKEEGAFPDQIAQTKISCRVCGHVERERKWRND